MNTSSGRSGMLWPMGSDTMGNKWGGLNRQFAGPLGQGFGFGPTTGRGSAQYARFQNQLGTAQGPMADFIRQGQGFLPTVQPGMQQIGTEIAGRARPAYEQLLAQIQQGQGMLGTAQQGLQGALGTAQGMNPYTQQMIQQAFAPEAQQGVQGGQQALNYAQQQAAQAFSPIQNQTLYQQALAQGTNAAQQGLAARGLSTGGAGAAAQEGLARQLATDFAGQQQAQQGAATQGLTGAASGLMGLQQGLQGLQGGALGAQGNLLGLQGQLSQGVAGLAPQGAQLAGMGMDALAPLMQNLSAQYGLPMSAMNDLMSFFSGAQQPNYGLLQASMPSVGQSQSSLGILG